MLKKKRWIVWLPLAGAFLAAYFHRTATGVVADRLMFDFSIENGAQLGVLSSIYFYSYAAMQLPAGILADFYGPRRTITLGLLTAALGAVLFAWAGSLGELYAGRLISTVGISVVYVNIVKILAEWFLPREFASMVGATVVAGSAGFLLAATPLAIMVEAFGWRAAFFVIAGYSLLMAVATWVAVRDRPQQMGLPSLSRMEETGGRQSCAKSGGESISISLVTVLKNPYTWWPFWASFTIYGVYMSFLGLWGIPYLMQVYGMERVEAANYMLVMATGTMVGGALVGVLSDRLRLRRGPYVWFTTAFLASWLVLTLWNGGKPPVGALYPLCFAMGLFMSGNNLNVACGKEVNPPNMTGVAAGFINTGGFVGAALMQPLFGWILDLSWDGAMADGIRLYHLAAYQNAFWLCCGVLVAAVLSTLLIKETHGVNIAAALNHTKE